MAWICVDLDDTLVEKQPLEPQMDGSDQMEEEQDPSAPQDQDVPIEGAVEAMSQLAAEGHRLTVFTSRFNAMPDEVKQRVREEIEQSLMQIGFPPMEVWTGSHKPAADLFIDNNAITFDGDWNLALAQTQAMMEDRGLVPGPQPGMAEQMMDEEPEEDEELPEEG